MLSLLNKESLISQVLEDKVILTVREAARPDTGKYHLKLKNPSGVAEGSVNVTVLGRPPT